MKQTTNAGLAKTHLVIGVVVLIILIAIVASFKNGSNDLSVATVVRGDISQEVSVTGRVKAVNNASLGLERGGRISWIGVEVGDSVVAGQRLLSIENGDLSASLDQARANVKKEEAKLAELVRGTRPEELQVSESQVASAEIALEDAKRSLVDSIVDAYTRSDDAVRNKVDVMFTNPRSTNPELVANSPDNQLNNDVKNGRVKIEAVLVAWEQSARSTSVASANFDAILKESKDDLEQTRLFLEKVGLLVNGLTPTATLSQTTIDTYKSNVSTARTNLNTGVTGLTAAEEKYRSAANALATSKHELALKQAGSTAENIRAEEAALDYARAEVKNASAALEKSIIRAPFTGVVVKQEAHTGEILPANTSVITLISDGHFKIEANVAEADIAKLAVGNTASVTLDAYGSETFFEAKVVTLEPGETIVDGVPTYKVTFEFINQDPRIKSGMTANIDIAVHSKTGILLIPQKAVTTINGEKKVTLIRGETQEEVMVKTGLRGGDALVEVVFGLNEGDTVIVPPTK